MANDREIPILPADGAEPPPPEPVKPREEPIQHGPSPRQTLNYIRSLLEAFVLDPKSKLGQNFLIDLNLVDLIVRASEITTEDAVLEVGTGTGTLTARLAEVAGHVVTIEIDKTFHPVAKQIVGHRPNVTYLLGDCLERKSVLNPDMMHAWREAGKRPGCKRRKLVANLPYVIATPLISNLLVDDPDIERMVVMVQWEIAERLCAKESTKDYNALSVLVQSIADVEIVRKVLPSNFYPRPKVDSAIVMIRPNAEKRAAVGDVVKFRSFLRNLYIHRRKNLRQALSGWPTGRREKTDVDAILAQLEIDGTKRAEALDLKEHLRLSTAFA